MQRSGRSGRPGIWRGRLRAVWTGLALALAPALVLAAMQLAPDSPSPATGHAEVIAHGVAAMPDANLAWRVVLDTAELPADATVEERALGFALADRTAIVVNDPDSGEQTRLAAGEASFVRGGAREQRASLGTVVAPYYRLALVPAAQANDAGGDRLVFAGASFPAPSGRAFDIDLVRDVLQPGERGTISAASAPVLVLATDGTLDVNGGNQLPVRLVGGQAASLEGPLTLTASGAGPATYVAAVIGPEVPAPPAAPTGSITMRVLGCPQTTLADAKAANFSGQTLASCGPLALDPPPSLILANGNPLAPDRTDPTTAIYAWTSLLYSPFPVGDVTLPATYAAYVLFDKNGAVVKSSDASVPPTVPSPGTVVIGANDPNPTTTLYLFAGGTGSISLAAYDCPAGMTLDNLTGDACPLATGGVAARLTAAKDGAVHDQSAATSQLPYSVWSDLPFDTYVITFPQMPAGYDTYTIPGAKYDAASQTFSVTLSSGDPDPKLSVYFLMPPGTPVAGTGTVTVRIFDCPAGLTRANFVPGQCGPTSGTSVRLVLDDGTVRGGDTARITGNVVSWPNVPAGKQSIQVFGLPPGYVDTIASGLTETAVNPPTFGVPLTAAAPSADVSVYNFQPAGATASPTP